MPQQAAGRRMEPPPSVPSASGPWPVATAAAAPPDEPPAVRDEIPRVPRDAEQRAVGQGLVAELRRRRLADEDGAGLAQPADGHRVLGRHLVGEDQRAHRRPDALGEQQILDRERHAVERAEQVPPAITAASARRAAVARLVRGHGDERVHRRLERLDPREHGVDHRDGRDLLGADLPGEGQRIGLIMRDRSRRKCPAISLANRSSCSRS